MDATKAARGRRLFIDWARGIAVLCMIEHHAFDAWMQDSFHGSAPDRLFRFLGGVAAPGFLFLAGLSLALGLERKQGRGALKWGVQRGAVVLLAAYAFRFQQWALWFGKAPTWTLLRIDVLNCIGVALVLTALLWSLGRAWALGLGAAAVVLVTPPLWAAPLAGFPQVLADYLHGGPPRALFPLFPWMAYAFAGAVVGLYLARTQDEARFMRRLLLGAAAVAIVTLAVDALPFQLYAQPLDWWRTSPAHFVLRNVSNVALLGACWGLERAFRGLELGPLLKLGQHSLLVYWVHIEIVYGRVLPGVRGQLTLPVAAPAVVLLIALMAVLAYAVELRPRPAAQPVLSPGDP